MTSRLLLRGVDLAFAVTLAVAACFKLAGLYVERLIALVPTDTAIATFALAELALATWLVSGRHQLRCRRTAIGLLFVFVIVGLVRVTRGDDSCGCFGALSVPPALTLAFSYGVLFGYVLTDPALHRSQTRLMTSPVSVVVTLIVLPLGLAGAVSYAR